MRNKLVLAAVSIGTMLTFVPASHAEMVCVKCNPQCTVTTESCSALLVCDVQARSAVAVRVQGVLDCL